MSTPCIIELRANESAPRRGRPRLPLTPDEIVADAVEAAAAGAAIFHWHGRDPQTLATSTDLDLNRGIARRVREATDLLLHPTLGGPSEPDPERRVAYLAALCVDPATRCDLAPVDFGSMNFDLWDAETRSFRSEHRVYLNPRSALRTVLTQLAALDATVLAACWSVGQIRTACRYQEAGLLGATYWQLVFTGPAMPDGMAPTRAGLEAMVEQVPPGQPWSVACIGGDALELAGWALELGGHVSLGLGDFAYPQLGSPSNADIVAHVAGLAAAAGRPVAAPDVARALVRAVAA